MALFLIVALEASAPDVDVAVRSKIPPEDAYQVESGKWVIDVSQSTAKAVSNALGLSEDASHLTLPVRAYFGRAKPDLWEWLAAKLAAKSNA